MSQPSQGKCGSTGFRVLLILLFACGLIARVAPLFNHEGRLLEQYPTEDGYLMLTIARNIALGHGMSTAEGTLATNGTQPLVNFIWAAGFWLLGGDKMAGVLFAQIIQVLFSAIAAWAIYRLGRRILGERERAFEIASLTAGAWYATLLSTTHGMNCLETGGYTLAVVCFALRFLGKEGDPLREWSFKHAASLGFVLGIVFWTRIDSVFLILGACLTRAAFVEGARFQVRARNFGSAVVMGATSVLVASPWLLYNKIGFGSFMPISGTAQSWAASFGQNLSQAVANLAEYALVVLPIPQPLETETVTTLLCVAVLALAGFVLVRTFRHGSLAARSFAPIALVFGLGLFTYYGLLFGAPHFVGRYLYPLSPFFALLWGTSVVSLWHRMQLDRSKVAGFVAASLLIAATVYPNLRQYEKGSKHQHFQVVEWVQENVDESQWVGAVQTGTLGFFHDRTLNLDGKVNPEALVAARDGRIPEYVVEKGLSYLADWEGIAAWHAEHEAIRENFEVVVHDLEENLAILRRKTSLAVSR